MKRLTAFAFLASFGAAISGAPAQAAEAVPAEIAVRLDARPLEFTASDAKLRRMEIIRRTMERDRYQRGRGYGRYDRGPAYGRYGRPDRGYYGGRPRYYGPGPGAYGQGVHPGTGYPPGVYGR